MIKLTVAAKDCLKHPEFSKDAISSHTPAKKKNKYFSSEKINSFVNPLISASICNIFLQTVLFQ
jgi:hypothetical protein